jgi:hypothetical protein
VDGAVLDESTLVDGNEALKLRRDTISEQFRYQLGEAMCQADGVVVTGLAGVALLFLDIG